MISQAAGEYRSIALAAVVGEEINIILFAKNDPVCFKKDHGIQRVLDATFGRLLSLKKFSLLIFFSLLNIDFQKGKKDKEYITVSRQLGAFSPKFCSTYTDDNDD